MSIDPDDSNDLVPSLFQVFVTGAGRHLVKDDANKRAPRGSPELTPLKAQAFDVLSKGPDVSQMRSWLGSVVDVVRPDITAEGILSAVEDQPIPKTRWEVKQDQLKVLKIDQSPPDVGIKVITAVQNISRCPKIKMRLQFVIAEKPEN